MWLWSVKIRKWFIYVFAWMRDKQFALSLFNRNVVARLRKQNLSTWFYVHKIQSFAFLQFFLFLLYLLSREFWWIYGDISFDYQKIIFMKYLYLGPVYAKISQSNLFACAFDQHGYKKLNLLLIVQENASNQICPEFHALL